MGTRPQLLTLAAGVAAALLLAPAGAAARLALVAATAQGAGAERVGLDADALARRLRANGVKHVARVRPAALTPARLASELAGIGSTPRDDVLVYLAGHGDRRGLLLGQDGARGYDRHTRTWRTNAFSQALRRVDPALTLTAARAAVARSARRSHVVLAARGLDTSRVRLGAFLP